jgi:ATP-dependent RNA helicase SUPV3L1/SUV3
MVSTIQEYDVAVIDEIQMLGDPERGAAWTRALLGLRAHEIHVCGGMEAAELVESLCQSTGDEFILRTYERLSPLE